MHKVREALNNISKDKEEKRETLSEASALCGKMDTLEMAFMAHLWNTILQRFQATSLQLQKPDINICTAKCLLSSLRDFVADLPHLSEYSLADLERKDPEIKIVIESLESGVKLCDLREQPLILGLWFREWSRLELRGGVLYRKRQNYGTYQLVLPATLRDMVLKSPHDDMGHLGIERTLDLVRSRFFWPEMSQAVEERIETCERCVRRKTTPDRAAPLVNIQTSRPLELVCMNFLSLEPD